MRLSDLKENLNAQVQILAEEKNSEKNFAIELSFLRQYLQNFPNDTDTLSLQLKLLKQFLALRWWRIQGTAKEYLHTPNALINQVMLAIAALICQPGENICQLLMPTLQHQIGGVDLSFTQEDGVFPLADYIIDETGTQLISIETAFELAKTDTNYIFPDYQENPKLAIKLSGFDLLAISEVAGEASHSYFKALFDYHVEKHTAHSLGLQLQAFAKVIQSGSIGGQGETKGHETQANTNTCANAIFAMYHQWQALKENNTALYKVVCSYSIPYYGEEATLENLLVVLFSGHPECEVSEQEKLLARSKVPLNCTAQISDGLLQLLQEYPALFYKNLSVDAAEAKEQKHDFSQMHNNLLASLPGRNECLVTSVEAASESGLKEFIYHHVCAAILGKVSDKDSFPYLVYQMVDGNRVVQHKLFQQFVISYFRNSQASQVNSDTLREYLELCLYRLLQMARSRLIQLDYDQFVPQALKCIFPSYNFLHLCRVLPYIEREQRIPIVLSMIKKGHISISTDRSTLIHILKALPSRSHLKFLTELEYKYYSFDDSDLSVTCLQEIINLLNLKDTALFLASLPKDLLAEMLSGKNCLTGSRLYQLLPFYRSLSSEKILLVLPYLKGMLGQNPRGEIMELAALQEIFSQIPFARRALYIEALSPQGLIQLVGDDHFSLCSCLARLPVAVQNRVILRLGKDIVNYVNNVEQFVQLVHYTSADALKTLIDNMGEKFFNVLDNDGYESGFAYVSRSFNNRKQILHQIFEQMPQDKRLSLAKLFVRKETRVIGASYSNDISFVLEHLHVNNRIAFLQSIDFDYYFCPQKADEISFRRPADLLKVLVMLPRRDQSLFLKQHKHFLQAFDAGLIVSLVKQQWQVRHDGGEFAEIKYTLAEQYKIVLEDVVEDVGAVIDKKSRYLINYLCQFSTTDEKLAFLKALPRDNVIACLAREYRNFGFACLANFFYLFTLGGGRIISGGEQSCLAFLLWLGDDILQVLNNDVSFVLFPLLNQLSSLGLNEYANTLSKEALAEIITHFSQLKLVLEGIEQERRYAFIMGRLGVGKVMQLAGFELLKLLQLLSPDEVISFCSSLGPDYIVRESIVGDVFSVFPLTSMQEHKDDPCDAVFLRALDYQHRPGLESKSEDVLDLRGRVYFFSCLIAAVSSRQRLYFIDKFLRCDTYFTLPDHVKILLDLINALSLSCDERVQLLSLVKVKQSLLQDKYRNEDEKKSHEIYCCYGESVFLYCGNVMQTAKTLLKEYVDGSAPSPLPLALGRLFKWRTKSRVFAANQILAGMQDGSVATLSQLIEVLLDSLSSYPVKDDEPSKLVAFRNEGYSSMLYRRMDYICTLSGLGFLQQIIDDYNSRLSSDSNFVSVEMSIKSP